MDSTTYKREMSRTDVFHRATLEETIAVLERDHADLAQRVRSQLERPPIQKPEQHTGGSASDIFRVELFRAEVDLIVQAMGVAEVGALGQDYKTTPAASHFAGLLDTWNRYRFLLDEKLAT